MAIRAIPTQSDRIYLSDVSEDVKELEGDCPRDEQAWVVVRQATESDHRRRSLAGSERKIEWSQGARTEKWNDDWLETYATEVYSCLIDAGNIETADSKPMFRFESGPNYRKLKVGYASFRESYGALPVSVTAAMRLAVLQLNPAWDWAGQIDTDEDETEGEVDLPDTSSS